jgi:hypothetical protein
MDQLMNWLGASRRFISTGNPGGNGVVERFNGEIVRAVKKMKLDDPSRADWRMRVAALAIQANSSFSRTIQGSPFFAFFGRSPNLPQDILWVPGVKESEGELLESEVAQMRAAMVEAKEIMRRINLIFAEELEVKNALKGSPDSRSFEPGDWVMIHNAVQLDKNVSKLLAHAGPFEVVEKVNDGLDYMLKGADGVVGWCSAYRLLPYNSTLKVVSGYGLAPSMIGPAMRYASTGELNKISDILSELYSSG